MCIITPKSSQALTYEGLFRRKTILSFYFVRKCKRFNTTDSSLERLSSGVVVVSVKVEESKETNEVQERKG